MERDRRVQAEARVTAELRKARRRRRSRTQLPSASTPCATSCSRPAAKPAPRSSRSPWRSFCRRRRSRAWEVETPESARARALLVAEHHLIAPVHVLAESTNALWKLQRIGRISAEQATLGARNIMQGFHRLVAVAAVLERGMELALRLGHPVYDCFYLALAETENAKLATFDGRFVERLRSARLLRFVKEF